MGAVLCLLSAACFGSMAIFGKFAYAAGVSGGVLLVVRFTLAAAILLIVLALRPNTRVRSTSVRPPSRRLSGVQMVALAIALGAVGYATQASLYFAALERMDASLLSLIFYAYPLMVTVAAVMLGRDHLTPGRIVALIGASCGALLVLLGAAGSTFDRIGALLALGSALTYTGYILIADAVVDRMPPIVLSALVMTGAAVTLTVRGALTGSLDLDFGLQGWIWLVCIALMSTVVAMLAFFAGLRRTGPSTAAIVSTFEPVVTTTLAAALLGEFLTPLQLLGGSLVLSAVIALQARPRRSSTRATPAEIAVPPVGVSGPTECRTVDRALPPAEAGTHM